MSYKPNYEQGRKGVHYNVADGIFYVSYDEKIKKIRESEEKKFGPERTYRKQLNKRIVEKVIQGWPEEEIQTAIEREFPKESTERISNLINHWQEKRKEAEEKSDMLAKKINDGEITKKEAHRSIRIKYNEYPLIKNMVMERLENQLKELGVEER